MVLEKHCYRGKKDLKFLFNITAVFIKVATSTLHLGHVTRSKIAFRSCA